MGKANLHENETGTSHEAKGSSMGCRGACGERGCLAPHTGIKHQVDRQQDANNSDCSSSGYRRPADPCLLVQTRFPVLPSLGDGVVLLKIVMNHDCPDAVMHSSRPPAENSLRARRIILEGERKVRP